MAPVTNGGRAWAEMVRAEHAQSDHVRSLTPQDDFWRGHSARFKPTPKEDARRDDTVEALIEVIRQDDSVLDVGAGAGRIAIPLAEHCREVIAVEPSASMREALAEQAETWGVGNIRVVASTWEEADVDPSDVVVCAHVVYTVENIEGFIEKLQAHARRMVAVIVFEEPAMAGFFPLWPTVHGEERLRLPCLPELRQVLTEMGIEHSAQALPLWGSRGFEDADAALRESATRLFVAPSTEAFERLEKALPDVLEPVDGQVRFQWSKPHRPWMVTWTPRSG
ncbi:MAG: methyltransferase domain-containing protein [Dehalococcoidia bacterium]